MSGNGTLTSEPSQHTGQCCCQHGRAGGCMGLSSPLIKPRHGESHSKCPVGASDPLGVAFRLCRAGLWLLHLHPPIHPSIRPPTHPPTHPFPSWSDAARTLSRQFALKKTSFFSPWDELWLDISAPVGAHKQGTWGEARPRHSLLSCARRPPRHVPASPALLEV